jgi:stage II sporulation protein D
MTARPRARPLAAVCAAGVWLLAVCSATRGQEAGDADLVAASSGRTVRVRIGRQIADVPTELYVARVVAGEGVPHAGDAAQQALAIAIRTFAAANVGRHRGDGFDLCDTTHCQVLRSSTPASRRAALATAGQVLIHAGRPADVFYSASCGGRSEAVADVWPGATDHPYLPSVEDDVHGGEVPWVAEIPAARVERALRRAGFEGRQLRDLRIERRSRSGRVAHLHLRGMRPDTIAGDDFRAAIGVRELRSTAFTVQKIGRAYRFTGRGYGHGVGLCVVGAGLRAARGETSAQILGRYYPGLTLSSRFPPAASTLEAAAAPVFSSPHGIAVRAPAIVDRVLVERLALAAREQLAAELGVTAPRTVTIEIFESIDRFRQVTGRPWWSSSVVDESTILLAPVSVLEQRDGLESAIRRGVAEMLTADALADRPAWVRRGAAHYFAAHERPSAIRHVNCPSEAELMLGVSAAAQRDADLRAKACFARALAATRDWREVR